MNVIQNELIAKVRELSQKYNRDIGQDVAKFMGYESELQYRTARRDKNCNHYSDVLAVRDISEHAYNVFERYLQMQNYKSVKKDLEDF